MHKPTPKTFEINNKKVSITPKSRMLKEQKVLCINIF